MKRFLLPALASFAALIAAPVQSQTVTVTAPNTVGPSGNPSAVAKTFIVNPDGTIGSLGAVRSSAFTTGQITVGTSSTLIAAARAARQRVGVTVTSAVQCSFGGPGVTLTTGWPLAAVAYASDSWDTAAALYGVCASSATVAYREVY